MGSFSIWHWLIVLAVVLVLFGGGGKLSRLMGDFGKGLKSFKKQIKDEGEDQAEAKPIENAAADPVASPSSGEDQAEAKSKENAAADPAPAASSSVENDTAAKR